MAHNVLDDSRPPMLRSKILLDVNLSLQNAKKSNVPNSIRRSAIAVIAEFIKHGQLHVDHLMVSTDNVADDSHPQILELNIIDAFIAPISHGRNLRITSSAISVIIGLAGYGDYLSLTVLKISMRSTDAFRPTIMFKLWNIVPNKIQSPSRKERQVAYIIIQQFIRYGTVK